VLNLRRGSTHDYPSIFLSLIILFAIMPVVNAQIGGQGAISGTVTDPSGAVVPNATVTARNTGTNSRPRAQRVVADITFSPPSLQETTPSRSECQDFIPSIKNTSLWTHCKQSDSVLLY